MKGLLAFSALFLVAACVTGYSVVRSDDLENTICNEDGVLVPHQDCSKYYICDNGLLILQACSVGTIFNEKEGICDFPANVPECVGGTRPPETTATTSTTTARPNTTTTSRTTTTTTTEVPTTPEEILTTEQEEDQTTTEEVTTRNTTTTRRTTTTTTTEVPEEPTSTTEEEEATTTRNTTRRTTTTTTTEGPTEDYTQSTEETIETTTVDNRICKDDGVYTLPVPGNCTLYTLCAHGQAVQQQCPPGLFYDPEIGVCNLADLVEECSAPLCAQGEIVFKPVPGNCTAFILCADGESSTGTCPNGTLFDPLVLQCNLASLVECEDSSSGNSTTNYLSQSKMALAKEDKSGVQGFFKRMFG